MGVGCGLLGNGIETARSGSNDEAKRNGIGRVSQGIERVWKMTGIVWGGGKCDIVIIAV